MRVVWRFGCAFLLLACLTMFVGCAPPAVEVTAVATTPIPAQSDWLECGQIFRAGAEGEWDYYLWGGFAATVVKKDGLFYLYYQGANDYDDDEETVTYRAIGLATSADGVNFSKHGDNPVLTWFPHNHLEEGAVSGGAFLDGNGDIAIYYGANNWIGGSKVNADGRLATASNGFNFTDQGVVLDHSNSSLWGSGDEIFPVIGFEDNGRYFTYYIPNGVLQQGDLGAAWGASPDDLPNSAAVRSGGSGISAWGAASHAKVGDDVYALFVNNIRAAGGPTLTAYFVSLDDPASLSAPVQSYQFNNVVQGIVYLDEETATWFMFYRHTDLESYGVKVAAADGRSIACPSSSKMYLPLIRSDARYAAPVDCAASTDGCKVNRNFTLLQCAP
ncbi:MAG: hypothetical protein R6X34_06730 [Chloroflexota bacterium]